VVEAYFKEPLWRDGIKSWNTPVSEDSRFKDTFEPAIYRIRNINTDHSTESFGPCPETSQISGNRFL